MKPSIRSSLLSSAALFCSTLAFAQTKAILDPDPTNVPNNGGAISVTFDINGSPNLPNPVTKSVPFPAQGFKLTDPTPPSPHAPVSPVFGAAPGGQTRFLFCIELDQNAPTSVSNVYEFESVADNILRRYDPLAVPPVSAVNDRVDNLRKLFGEVFPDFTTYAALLDNAPHNNLETNLTPAIAGSLTGITRDQFAQAFQLAVWELVYDDNLNVTTLGVGTGRFSVNPSGFTTQVTLAQQMLNAVSTSQKSATLFALHNIVPGNQQDYIYQQFPDTPKIEVPEPSTYALLVGLGTLGVVTLRRRFRRSFVA